MARQNYNVKIGLSDQQVESLTRNYTQVEDIVVIQSIAQESVSKLADGGMVLPNSSVNRIGKAIGGARTPEEIAAAVEASVGKAGDNLVVSLTLDPVWIGELILKADGCDMKLDSLVSDLFSQAMHMGMFYDMETERIPVFLTPEQHAIIRAKLNTPQDEPLFGESIVKHFGWKREEEPTEDNLFQEVTT